MPIQNYPQPPEKPEFVLREGYDKNMPRITYDFNDGCRVMIHPMEDAEKTPTFSVLGRPRDARNGKQEEGTAVDLAALRRQAADIVLKEGMAE